MGSCQINLFSIGGKKSLPIPTGYFINSNKIIMDIAENNRYI
jgi:hypothetical protein